MNRRRDHSKKIPPVASDAKLANLEAFLLATEGPAGQAILDAARRGVDARGNPIAPWTTENTLDWFARRRAMEAMAATDRAAEPGRVDRKPRDDLGHACRRRPCPRRAKVHGDSMRAAGLRDGDIVDVDPSAEPKNGDIVLARIDGVGKLIRTLRVIGGAQLLFASDPNLAPVVIDDPARVVYMGVVRSRKL